MKKLILTLFFSFSLLFSSSGYAECISGDCINGYGTFTYADGSKYVGEFKDGKRNGQGTKTQVDGYTYDGLWISDKTELNEREIDLKHVFFPIKENWDENWLNENLMIAPKSIHQYPMNVSQGNFEPKKIRFNINQSVNGVSISGILIPRQILGELSTSWGSAIVKFKRIKDGKFFEIYARKIIFDDSENVCQSGEIDIADPDLCKLSSAEPMKIDNDIVWGSTFSFKDIDYDGEEELIVNEKLATRVGSDYIAYNIINTKHDFRIDERNPISVVYNDRGYFIEDKKLLKNRYSSGCCNWITYTWKAEKGSYELIEIEDNLD